MGLELNTFFNDYNKMERRDFLKILLVSGLGVAAGKACSVIDKSIDPGSFPIPTETPLPTDIPHKEEVVPYGQYWIGESGVGAVTALELQISPDQRFIDEVKNRVFQIPEFKDKNIGVHVYDMVGETGKAPFVLVSENNEKGEAQKAYVAFWVDEKGVQRPPVDGKIYALYPLLIEPQDNGTVLIGIPDIMNLGMQLPELFYIDNQKNVFFFPPYTDKKSPDSPGGGIKVQAIPVEMFVPEAPSLPENLGGSPEYAEEIMEQGYAWQYNADRTQFLVEWEKGSGNFVLSGKFVNGEWRVDENCKFVYIPEGASNITGNETLPFSKWSKIAGKSEHFGVEKGYPDEAFIGFISTGKIIQSPRYDFETGAKLPGQVFYIEAFTQKKDGTPIKINVVVAVDMGSGKNELAIGDGDPDNNGMYDLFYYAEKFKSGKKSSVRFLIGGSYNGPYYEYLKLLNNDNKKFIETGIPPAIIFPFPPFEQL